VSAAPLSELRGGIPLALALGFTPTTAFFLALLGNLLPMPLILWLVPKLIHAVERFPGWLGEAGRKYLAWQERRHRRIVRWGPWALMVFVAVPLPGTGVWTGAVLAALLGIPMRFALLPLAFGVILAGSLVLLASLGFFRVFGS
ncbi:MAG: small multi-drug export protein, partial [Candidatus Bipolaricaulota bacterium]|nr:small multi-drug export protein [Candidatus Bipolaricaulota bacterium]MDW8127098.1 small multi-drug export protein [Candidatus Bipolaricaulota bacterium]